MKTYIIPVEIIKPVVYVEIEIQAKNKKDAIKKAKSNFQKYIFQEDIHLVQYNGLDWKGVRKDDVWES